MGRGQARSAALVQTGQGGCKDGKELGLHRASGKNVKVSKDVPRRFHLVLWPGESPPRIFSLANLFRAVFKMH